MRTKFILSAVAALFALVGVVPAGAEEKNGLLVTVAKKTLDRDAGVTTSGRSERTQGLGVSIKNTSIREFPAGEVQWTIVVRKTYEGGLQKYTGMEPLKALRPSSTADLLLGAAQTSGYHSDYANYKDKLEYEVVIVHNGHETLRACSDPNFAALASRATSMDRSESRRSRLPAPEDPAPALPGTGLKPAPGAFPPGTTTGPGNFPPKTLPPRPTPAVPTPPATKPVEPAVPAPTEATPPPPPVEQPAGKPFDFFNLDKKK